MQICSWSDVASCPLISVCPASCPQPLGPKRWAVDDYPSAGRVLQTAQHEPTPRSVDDWHVRGHCGVPEQPSSSSYPFTLEKEFSCELTPPNFNERVSKWAHILYSPSLLVAFRLCICVPVCLRVWVSMYMPGRWNELRRREEKGAFVSVTYLSPFFVKSKFPSSERGQSWELCFYDNLWGSVTACLPRQNDYLSSMTPCQDANWTSCLDSVESEGQRLV